MIQATRFSSMHIRLYYILQLLEWRFFSLERL